MWRKHLADLIGVEVASTYEVIAIPKDGVSGASVVLLEDAATDMRYALKFGEPSLNPTHSISAQVGNREILAPHFGEHHLPRVYAHSQMAMLMRMVEGDSLYEVVQQKSYDPVYLRGMAERIFRRFGAVWYKTATPHKEELILAREPLRRVERVKAAVLGRAFHDVPIEEYADAPMKINGRLVPSFNDLLRKARDLYRPPKQLVTCHGDTNGENILIDGNHGWWLIDWEWAGLHDWRIVLSFMVGWWISNTSMVRSSSVEVADGELRLNYELVVDELARVIVDCGWKFGEEVAVKFEEPDWREQVELQVAILLLGDIRFATERRRPTHDVPLLGEGLVYLAGLK